MMPLIPSPGIPKTSRTSHSMRDSTRTSLAVNLGHGTFQLWITPRIAQFQLGGSNVRAYWSQSAWEWLNRPT
jgi:hypothetical protein